MDEQTSADYLKNTQPNTKPKNWSELTSDKKIERMREIVKNLIYRMAKSESDICNLRQKLRKHEHRDGKVVEVKEISSYDDSNSGLGHKISNHQENYF